MGQGLGVSIGVRCDDMNAMKATLLLAWMSGSLIVDEAMAGTGIKVRTGQLPCVLRSRTTKARNK
jgi:hypothetical protein